MKNKKIEQLQTGYVPEDKTNYHDTVKLLKNYRDIVWGLEVEAAQAQSSFYNEYGMGLDDYLESAYIAGANFNGTELEHRAKSLKRSQNMIKLINNSVFLIREKHKNGIIYYWILYYTFLCQNEPDCINDILVKLGSHLGDVSTDFYYANRKQAITILSSVLWGYSKKELICIVEAIVGEEKSSTKKVKKELDRQITK